MTTCQSALDRLDSLIKKSRVHLYKPVQIAEILYKHRTFVANDLAIENFLLTDIESYRNASKKWRDVVTSKLIGRVSTSSQKFQDNLFEANAIPPETLEILGKLNLEIPWIVEAYIYDSLEKRLGLVSKVKGYLVSATPESFKLQTMVDMFEKEPGLKRSIDKCYEISVYALFSTIVRALKVEMTLAIKNEDLEIINDFKDFIEWVIGLRNGANSITVDAALYRVWVTNAADRGLDMWTNFWIAIQVKHLTLDPDLIENIAESITADRIVIVCLDSDKTAINLLLSQVWWWERIQGIVTLGDLCKWYDVCLSTKYRADLSTSLLQDLSNEFSAEFPSTSELAPFMKERGYDQINLSSIRSF